MTYRILVEKLRIAGKKMVTRDELRVYCKLLGISYESAINYLLDNEYVVRVFRGIFYVKSIEERKFGKEDMTFYEILKEALKIKGVKNWYLGLDTALKFNNLTHEFFTITFVINDKLFRAKPMLIMGRKVKFYKLTPKMFFFGIVKHTFPYSDPEKTILDEVYLGLYKGLTEYLIKNRIIDYIDNCDKKKLIKYAKHYPKTVLRMVEKIKDDTKGNN